MGKHGPLQVDNVSILTNGGMDEALTSAAHNIKEVRGYCVQASWTEGSSPAGTVYLEGSNDGETYALLDKSFTVSTNSGSDFLQDENAFYSFVRAQYSRASGDGTLNITISTKQ